MLTGTHPFRRAAVLANDATAADGALGGGGHAPGLSEATSAFFRTALSMDRALRPREPLEFLAACEQVLA
jgi:hypothetical protein